MAGATKTLLVAWERECRGLDVSEMGALWSLAAAAECGFYGIGGRVRMTGPAIAEMFGIAGSPKGLLDSLKKKGRVRCELAMVREGNVQVYDIDVCLWSDRWARERQEKRSANA